MLKVGYKISLGSLTLDSAADPRTELVAVDVLRILNAPIDHCRLTLYAPPPPEAGLLEQAAAAAAGALGFGGGAEAAPAFSVQVRGQAIKHGAAVEVALTAGDVSAKVITAEVVSVRSSFTETTILGRTALQTLSALRLNQVYENQALGRIVSDLAGQAGVATGNVEEGSTYPYLVVDGSRSVLDHVRNLARREGMNVYVDADNNLVVKAFVKSNADHVFHYGIHLLDLTLFYQEPSPDHVVVYGESPSSNQGGESWHWLAKDLAPFRAEVGDGGRTLALQDGAVRTKDAADRMAVARFGAIKDGGTRGRLRLLGNPVLEPGDAVEIRGAPQPELNGLYRVEWVRHVLERRSGFVTHLGVTGQGGAQQAGGSSASWPAPSREP